MFYLHPVRYHPSVDCFAIHPAPLFQELVHQDVILNENMQAGVRLYYLHNIVYSMIYIYSNIFRYTGLLTMRTLEIKPIIDFCLVIFYKK